MGSVEQHDCEDDDAVAAGSSKEREACERSDRGVQTTGVEEEHNPEHLPGRYRHGRELSIEKRPHGRADEEEQRYAPDDSQVGTPLFVVEYR